MEAIMIAERKVHQQEQPEESENGFRQRRARTGDYELLLRVPRTRSGMFYPALLSIIRQENKEQNRLIFSMYSKGLTTNQ